ncbi:MAG TPA: phenylalanine--tRNA ligase subunit beta, partial [Candidatus Kapabacteria bacterium]|nr:phenylalanine--tRNA ligase subunit beta [Candidatus Kapabacteria bacterium]
VAVATIGADLGEGLVIKKSKIRGEASEGMLCSAKELGLSEDHSGIMDLPSDLKIGTPLTEALGMTDVIFDIGITPNRADCLSHIGIAREVSIANGKPVKKPEINSEYLDTSKEKASDLAKVSIDDPDLCPRYAARIVRGVKIAESPEWLKQKLEAVGLRPRNNIVDVTNFVLMECGHPLHAFDLNTVNDKHVIVRRAKGFVEKFVTLDSKERVLSPDTLLISDADKPLAIAGIMGGESSEITDATTDVLIESAYFNPSSIRRSAKLLGLSTDASYRFERGVDMANVLFAVDRAAALMAELGGGEVATGIIDVYPKTIEPKTFSFRPAKANALLGTDLDTDVIEKNISSVGFTIEGLGSDSWKLTAPSWRVDLEQEVDATEEIARIYGYDNLPTSIEDRIPINKERDVLSKLEFDAIVRSQLISLGFFECISTPMLSASIAEIFHAKPVEVMNPLTVDLERMRSSIIGNLLDVARRNERHSASGQRLFEMGAVFHYSDTKEQVASVKQQWEISLLLKDNLEEKNPYNTKEPQADIFYLRGAIEQFLNRIGLLGVVCLPLGEVKSLGDWASANNYLDMSQSLGFVFKKELIAIAGKVGKQVSDKFDLRSAPYIATLSYDRLHELARAARRGERKVGALPKYPAVERDIALMIGRAVTARQLLDEVRTKIPAELLEDLRIFDQFESKEMKAAGTKSIGVRLSLRSNERTLEDSEVDTVVSGVVESLKSSLGATLRS